MCFISSLYCDVTRFISGGPCRAWLALVDPVSCLIAAAFVRETKADERLNWFERRRWGSRSPLVSLHAPARAARTDLKRSFPAVMFLNMP